MTVTDLEAALQTRIIIIWLDSSLLSEISVELQVDIIFQVLQLSLTIFFAAIMHQYILSSFNLRMTSSIEDEFEGCYWQGEPVVRKCIWGGSCETGKN